MSRKVFTHVGLVGLSNEMLIRMLAGTMGIYVYLMVVSETIGVKTIPLMASIAFSKSSSVFNSTGKLC